MTVIPIVVGGLGAGPKGLVRKLDDLEIGGRIETLEKKFGQNFAKLGRVAVTLTLVIDHQLNLMGKPAKSNNNNKNNNNNERTEK